MARAARHGQTAASMPPTGQFSDLPPRQPDADARARLTLQAQPRIPAMPEPTLPVILPPVDVSPD